MVKNNRGLLVVLLGTGVLIALIVAITSLNIGIKIGGKNDKPVLGTQSDSVEDHHKPKPAESVLFDSLVGKTAPDFTLETYDSKRVTLSSLRGKNVILFFNEGLMCYPACWNQIAAFGKDKEFESKNTIVLNIVIDPREKWKEAVDKMPELAQAMVVLDTNVQVSSTYSVLSLPSSMHRGQFPGHSYVIVDKEGIIRFAKDDAQMAVRNKELAAEIDKLN